MGHAGRCQLMEASTWGARRQMVPDRDTVRASSKASGEARRDHDVLNEVICHRLPASLHEFDERKEFIRTAGHARCLDRCTDRARGRDPRHSGRGRRGPARSP